MSKQIQTLKLDCSKELQKLFSENDNILRFKMTLKKVNLNHQYQKKDLHFLLNSFLRGDVFSQDILNEFWQYHFDKQATIDQVIKAYCGAINKLLYKIFETNININQIVKQKQTSKLILDFNMVNKSIIKIQELSEDIKHFTNSLNQFVLPFGLNFTNLIANYKQKISQQTNKAQIKSIQQNYQQEQNQVNFNSQIISQSSKLNRNIPHFANRVYNQCLKSEINNYYYLGVFILAFVLILQLSICFHKYNFVNVTGYQIQLLFVFLLFINLSLQNIHSFNKKQIKKHISYSADLKQSNQTQNPNYSNNLKIKKQQPLQLSLFEDYAYVSLRLILILIVLDLLWLVFSKESYYQKKNNHGPQSIDLPTGIYNKLIYYASLISLLLKVLLAYQDYL